MRTRWITALVVLLCVALAAATVAALDARRDLSRSREQAQELRSELDEARAEAERLASELDEQRADPTPPAPDSGGDGSGGSAVDGLLDALGGEVPGLECLTRPPSGDLGDLFGGGEPVPADPDVLVDHIAEQVATLRGLAVDTDVDARFLPPEEVARRITRLLAEDYPEAEADTDRRLLASLGVLAPDTDLRALQRDLLAGQVAGFYVPETGELVVRSTGDDRSGVVDRVTLAHEIDHALTDRALRLPVGDAAPGDDDANLAALAVVEGDASLVMNRWALENLSLTDQLSLAMDPAVVAAQGQLDDVPHYLAEELMFPYLDGLEMVCDVWLEAGWAGVDRLYGDPPDTTAQVMFPARRRADEPAAGVAELRAPAGFDQLRTDTFGAARLSWLFEAPGDAPDRALSDPEQRAAAWRGGTATVWADGSRTAVGLSLVGREGGLCGSVTAWYAAAFTEASRSPVPTGTAFDGDRQDAVVACPGEQVRVGIGPEPAVAAAVAGAG